MSQYSCPHCKKELPEDRYFAGICPGCHRVFEIERTPETVPKETLKNIYAFLYRGDSGDYQVMFVEGCKMIWVLGVFGFLFGVTVVLFFTVAIISSVILRIKRRQQS